jgi:serine/threonine-protein kinase
VEVVVVQKCENCGVQLSLPADSCQQCDHPIRSNIDPFATRTYTGLDDSVVPPTLDPDSVVPEPHDVQTRVAGDVLTTVHRYRILEFVARVGPGQVYLARDEDLGREVDLKQIKGSFADYPEFRSRFLLEARACANLEHPGIVPVYGIGQDPEGRPFFPMRLIRGETLRHAIHQHHQLASVKRDRGEQALGLQRLLKRFVDVCNTIAYAHSRGVLHLDIKPDNIMLGKYGETFVVEWGLAKVLSRPDISGTATEGPSAFHPDAFHRSTPTGAVVGTPAYMSPEQAAGREDLLEPASDVYSLGATLYEILTDRAPFETRVGLANVLLSIRQSLVPKPRELKPGIPAGLEAICLKAMALKPEDRFVSPIALADDVERWLAGAPISALKQTAEPRPKLWRRLFDWWKTGEES